MHELIILSRSDAEEYTSDKPYVVISITDPDWDEAEFDHDPNRLAVLRLQFHDIEPEKYLSKTGVAMNNRDAVDIAKFVKRHLSRTKAIVCHCEAGVSRSAAVIAAIGHWLYGPEYAQSVFKNPIYLPNKSVYRMVLKSLQAISAK